MNIQIAIQKMKISSVLKTGDMSDRFILDKLFLLSHIVFAIREFRIINGANYDIGIISQRVGRLIRGQGFQDSRIRVKKLLKTNK
jgi:hypothetical protein